MRRSAEERFWAKVVKTDSCWLWVGATSAPKGYGAFTIPADGQWRNVLAHRFAYELLVGPIPVGLQIDHLCFVTNCVRPTHLEVVTPGVNKRRGTQRKTHCKRGHPYDLASPLRRCVACKRASRRLSERRRRMRLKMAEQSNGGGR
jgi:hypothetical protein